MAEIGTPENPEIIEPGQTPRSRSTPPRFSRGPVVVQILRLLGALTLPALGLDLLLVFCVQTAMREGGALPVLAALVLILPSFLLTLLAGAVNLVLWPALFAILSGRAVQMPNFRFINLRR